MFSAYIQSNAPYLTGQWIANSQVSPQVNIISLAEDETEKKCHEKKGVSISFALFKKGSYFCNVL